MNGLKILLWVTAVFCFSGFAIAALPWNMVVEIHTLAGLEAPAPEPFTVFLYRLGCAVIGLIGVFFAVLALNPLASGPMLPFAGCGLMCYGGFCLAGGLRYELPIWLFGGDVAFGFIAGLLVVVWGWKARRTAAQARKFSGGPMVSAS